MLGHRIISLFSYRYFDQIWKNNYIAQYAKDAIKFGVARSGLTSSVLQTKWRLPYNFSVII